MKIREVLQEFVPCEEEYYSTKARKILTKVENAFKVRTHLDPAIESGNYQRHDLPHPLLKALSGI